MEAPLTLRTRARQVAFEIRGYVLAAVHRPAEQTEFIMISGGRRGSHLLIDLINSHPEVHCDSELLHPGCVRAGLWFPETYLRGHRSQSRAAAYGYKASLYHLERQNFELQLFLKRFCRRGGRIIHLRRRDLFRSAVSAMIAHQRCRHHDDRSDPLRGQAFTIDCTELHYRLRRRLETDCKEQNLLADLPHLALTYEADLLDASRHQATADAAFRWLHRTSVPVTSTLQRTSPNRLEDVIRNYDEVMESIRHSEFEHLIRTPDHSLQVA